MADEVSREAGQVIGALIALSLCSAVILGATNTVPIGLAVLVWLGWCLGGLAGGMITRGMVPIFNGCNCGKCQATTGGIVIGFVLWPIAIPGLVLAAIGAAIVRGVL